MGITTLMVVGRDQLAWQELESRPLEAHEVRIRNRWGTEKHGTMRAIVKGYGDRRGQFDGELGLYFGQGIAWNYPLPLGNMNFGEVLEVGADVTTVKVGDLVAASTPFQLESITWERNCFLAPPDLDWRDAFALDPGEFALGAVRDGHVRFGDHVAVFSMGAIGLVAVQMAKAAGAERVVAIDPIASRREAALACGADEVVGESMEDVGWQIRRLARREGIDVAIDFSGAVPAMQAAFRALGPQGTLVLGAYPDETQAVVDFGRESHANLLKIVFTRACTDPQPDHPRWDWHRIRRAVWNAILRGKLKGAPIMDEPIPFDDVLEAYRRVVDQPGDSIKLTVRYPD